MRTFRVAKRFRPVVESTRYKNSPYVARTAFRTASLRKAILHQMTKRIRQECISLCSKKEQQSILRYCSSNDVKTFRWRAISRELKCRAPTLYHALRAACFHTRKKRVTSGRLILPMAAALLLRGRNQFMNMPQRVISAILYTGHCSKMVYYM